MSAGPPLSVGGASGVLYGLAEELLDRVGAQLLLGPCERVCVRHGDHAAGEPAQARGAPERWGLIRTATTDGIIMLTFTPLEGVSEVVLGFLPAEMRPQDDS